MKQKVVLRPQREINESFAQVIEKEYGTGAAQQIIGEAAVRQTLPFSDQFMDKLPELAADPRATTPGGQTVTTRNGTPGLDDPSSSDVA